jgi:hypothetical protein
MEDLWIVQKKSRDEGWLGDMGSKERRFVENTMMDYTEELKQFL